MDFYEWLKTQFTDLESAKIFFKKFMLEMDQETPFGGFTQRAMAGHISQALEGKTQDYSEEYESYLNTKYGIDIYWSI